MGKGRGGQMAQRYTFMSNLPLDLLHDESHDHVNRIDVLYGQGGSFGYLNQERTTKDWKLENCRGPKQPVDNKGHCEKPKDDQWTTELREQMPSTLYEWMSHAKEKKYDFPDDILTGKEEDYNLNPAVLKTEYGSDVPKFLQNHVFPRFKIHMTLDIGDRCATLEKHRRVEQFVEIYEKSKDLRQFHDSWFWEEDFCVTGKEEGFVATIFDMSRFALAQGFHRYQRAKGFQFWLQHNIEQFDQPLFGEQVYIEFYDCDSMLSKKVKKARCRHNWPFMTQLLSPAKAGGGGLLGGEKLKKLERPAQP
ncbi:unnamed protein product [Amoebophrya sp. A120]|nr:unnamed protein product [Amoebophrya sp. A120]|eukprot:GSA120T00013503001.1